MRISLPYQLIKPVYILIFLSQRQSGRIRQRRIARFARETGKEKRATEIRFLFFLSGQWWNDDITIERTERLCPLQFIATNNLVASKGLN